MKRHFYPRRTKATAFYFIAKVFLVFALSVGIFPLKAQTVLAFNNADQQGPATAQQHSDGQRINIKVKNEKLQTVLSRLEKQVAYVFVYSPDDINTTQRISLDARNIELTEVLNSIAKQIGADYEIINDKIILRNKTAIDKGNNGNKVSISTPGVQTNGLLNDVVITGHIVDESGHAVSGASIILKGTTLGTTTNSNGDFSLALPDAKASGVLVISYVGYEASEILLEGKRSISLALTPTAKSLDDVVVVGYGTQRRASVTGAVDKINRAALDGRPVVNLSQALQGVSPNLIIQQRNFEPGQPVNLNIRGLGTLGDNTPLVVIDGIVGGDINLINPNDIESISILKDAGSAAIYGSRSANGVILITTKKGRKNEKASVSYTAIYGTQSPRITYTPVHAWENAYYKNESLTNSGQQPLFSPQQIRDFQTAGDGDWRVKNILQNAAQQSHTVSISGGSATSTYLFSVGYLNQQNNFIGPDYGYKRYNFRLNQSTEIGRLKVSAVLSYIKSQNKDHSLSSDVLIVDAGRVPLYYSFTDSAGNYLTNSVSSQYNPKAILEKGGYRKSNDDEVFGSFNAEFSILKNLKVRGVFGGTVRSNSQFGRRLQINFAPTGQYGQDREVFDANSKSLLTNTQLLAEYNKTFGRHEVKILAGATNESFESQASRLTKTLTDSSLGTPTTGTIINANSFNTNQGTVESSINSLLGRVSYNFSQKYFAEFSFRYDGSSNFSKTNRWGFFPSVSLAWNLTDEGFMKGLHDKLGTVKLRTSYGLLGNQNVRPYQYQTSFFNYTNAYGFNNSVVGAAGYSLGNPALTWEKATTFNIGVDAQLLKRRLDLSFDYFRKTTKDILVPRKDIPLLFGATFPDFNAAKVANQGWEVKATYTLAGRVLTQTFMANLADNLNELKSFTFDATELVERKEEFEFVRRVGQPITVYQGYKRDGYFQNLDDIKGAAIFAGQNRASISPGDIKFVDKNGDGVIDDKDKFILGNPISPLHVWLYLHGAGKRFRSVVFYTRRGQAGCDGAGRVSGALSLWLWRHYVHASNRLLDTHQPRC